MAVRIRMKKMGRKHRAFFRICVMDSRVQRDGKAIEEVGFYDPMVHDKSARVKLNLERVEYWMSVGAQPSEKVNALDSQGEAEQVRQGSRASSDAGSKGEGSRSSSRS
jgi:small subunit ribosomal protein S16